MAIAGPPGAGKSTLAAALADALGAGARVVPMDGFHLDDMVLAARGLRHRKGAPETFDVAGFLHLLARLRHEDDVAIPIFDRTLELSRAAADVVTAADRILLVEGNYLLLTAGPWAAARPHFDLTVFLNVPEAELDRRLMARWAHYGKTPEAALFHARSFLRAAYTVLHPHWDEANAREFLRLYALDVGPLRAGEAVTLDFLPASPESGPDEH